MRFGATPNEALLAESVPPPRGSPHCQEGPGRAGRTLPARALRQFGGKGRALAFRRVELLVLREGRLFGGVGSTQSSTLIRGVPLPRIADVLLSEQTHDNDNDHSYSQLPATEALTYPTGERVRGPWPLPVWRRKKSLDARQIEQCVPLRSLAA